MLKGFKRTANPKEFYRIGEDKDGNETTRVLFNVDKHPGYKDEMDAFVAAGGVIEEAETAEELAAREAKEALDALKNQESKLLGYIEKYAYHVTEHTPDSGRRFAQQHQVWKDRILLWESQLLTVKSGTLVEIAPVPTF